MSHTIVEAEGLAKTYGNREIFSRMSFKLYPHEMIALWGKSGSGKSSLLQILGTLDFQYTGDCFLFGKQVKTLSKDAQALLRNQDIGFVFQSFELLKHISCLENVLLPNWFCQKPQPINIAQKKAVALCEQLGLTACMNQFPNQLSGGEKQRVAVARALFHSPKLLLCDEPTNNLDEKNSHIILSLFKQAASQGSTVIIATHEEAIASLCDRKLTLES